MSYISERTRARIQAVQLLFQADIQDIDPGDLLDGGLYALEDGPLDPFARRLVEGVFCNRHAIELLLDTISPGWSYSRMPVVDRSIMAIALYEMFFTPETSTAVAINEAVSIAKIYAGDDSSGFVNGVLGDVYRLVEEAPDEGLSDLARRLQQERSLEDTYGNLDNSGDMVSFETFDDDMIEEDRQDFEDLWILEEDGADTEATDDGDD